MTAEREKAFIRYRANTEALEELLGFLYAECCTRNKAVEPKKNRRPLQMKEAVMSTENVKDVVREKYGQAALRAKTGAGELVLRRRRGRSRRAAIRSRRISTTPAQEGEVPDLALKASLGCGNPTALAELKAGRDGARSRLRRRHRRAALRAPRRADRQGLRPRHDGRDARASPRRTRRKSGLENVEFLKGEIEHIPLPDNSVDVIISNCVINLSGDKDRVIKEAFRVLKPGGRFAVSDVVVRGDVPAEIRKNMELWVGCVAGALGDYEYVAKLAKAGFDGIDIETTRVYSIEDARTFLAGEGLDVDALAKEVDGTFISGFIRATKPAAAACCGPSCCN